MQPRNQDPNQFMLWVALVLAIIACFMLAHGAEGQTCEEQCAIPCAISTQEVCDLCLDACVVPPRRIAPIGPSRQPRVNYVLDLDIGLTALSYKDADFPGWDGTAEAISELGFTSAQLWMDIPPYCAGHWVEPYPSHLWVQDVFDCEAERAIFHSGLKQVFIKASVPSWQIRDGNCYIMDTTPQAFILNRLYEAGWWKDMTIVFVRWEQDWYPEGCPHGVQHGDLEGRMDWLIRYESEQQRQFDQARKAMLQRYPHAKLRVLRAMTVNQFPGYNVDDDHPTVAQAIGRMVDDPKLYEPDLVAISYWRRGIDPVPALDWIEEVTRYPRTRMFLIEFGARESEQPDRFDDYIPVFREWGIRTILIWVYEDNWSGRYGLTEAGLEALRRLNE